jgi:hypothetical protein
MCVVFSEAFGLKPASAFDVKLHLAKRAMLGLILLMGWVSAAPVAAGGANSKGDAEQHPAQNRIDELVFGQLQQRNIPPARLCSDAVFVRRVYLDVTGTLPTALAAQQFILDHSANKRAALVERLLASDENADYQAMKWGDLLRIKAEFPINLWPNAAQAYHRWIHGAIRDNRPWDKIAAELLTASGSNFENPPVNFYRAMQNRTPSGIAKTVALTFLGERAESWPSNELANLAVFFANVGYKSTAEWKEEIVFFNPCATNTGAMNGSPCAAILPDGERVILLPGQDPRRVFADWLVKNPRFARNLVNRAWSWLLGRGIVHEPDDFRPDNPPSNPELLAFLEQELISSGYDLKHVFRLILNSKTYQLCAIAGDASPEAVANFAGYPLRRLEAEVLIDAIDQITGSTEKYSSAIPEPYTFIPENERSVALPDGSITSSFLEMFGRPPRDTGQESERNNRISAAQKLWLLNSSQFQRKIEQSRMVEYQAQPGKTPVQIVSALYLGILSRFPTAGESAIAQAQFQKPGMNRRQAVIDLAWALMNSAEFLYRH